jgi:hypothetical protein
MGSAKQDFSLKVVEIQTLDKGEAIISTLKDSMHQKPAGFYTRQISREGR